MICLSVIRISVSLKWLYMVHTPTFSSPRRTESLVHRSVLHFPRWRWHRGPLDLMERTKVTIRLMFFRIQHVNSMTLTHQWPRFWEKQILVWWLDSASVCLPELRCCFCSDTSKPSYHPASEARPACLTAKHSAHLQTHKNRLSNRPYSWLRKHWKLINMSTCKKMFNWATCQWGLPIAFSLVTLHVRGPSNSIVLMLRSMFWWTEKSGSSWIRMSALVTYTWDIKLFLTLYSL